MFLWIQTNESYEEETWWCQLRERHKQTNCVTSESKNALRITKCRTFEWWWSRRRTLLNLSVIGWLVAFHITGRFLSSKPSGEITWMKSRHIIKVIKQLKLLSNKCVWIGIKPKEMSQGFGNKCDNEWLKNFSFY